MSAFGLLLGGGLLAGGVSALEHAKASMEQKPWAGREPTWVGPQSGASKKAGVFVPLSFSF